MTERNAALLREVADYIEMHPERYRQGVWLEDGSGMEWSHDLERYVEAARKGPVCGTQGCVAGTTVLLTPREEVRWTLDLGDELVQSVIGGAGYTTGDVAYDGAVATMIWFQSEGARLLGLEPSEANWIFDADRLESAMPKMLRALADGADMEEIDHIEELFDMDYDQSGDDE